MTDWSTPRTAPVVIRRRESIAGWATSRDSPLRRMDWPLSIATLTLCGLGAVLVWAATKPHNAALSLDPNAYLKKDLLNVIIGVTLASVVAMTDWRKLRAYTPIVYVASCLGLLVVLSPFGSTINGSHSWIVLPAGFEIQPSEFAKIALVVGLAMILGELRDGETEPRGSDVLAALALVAVPTLLVMLQPDLGTVLVFSAIVLGSIAMSGARLRWVAGLILAGAVFFYGAIHFHVLKPYQVDRLTSFANPNAGSRTTGYNTQQARIAIGSGGVFGKGLFHGSQTNGAFVPAQQTDFIFTVAGEELGLVGGATVIGLMGIVMWRGFRIARRADDPFAGLVATGVVSWFAFQTFENVGMTLGIMPVTGLPLPFVSYGGSAMFANMIAIGLLQNVRMTSRDI